MGKYGNIDGIATLTNDPLALDNINKFKVGDRVICNDKCHWYGQGIGYSE